MKKFLLDRLSFIRDFAFFRLINIT